MSISYFKEISFKPRTAGVSSVNILSIIKIGWNELRDFRRLKKGMKHSEYEKKYEKYQDIILYLFFGICTTLINVILYWINAHFWGLNVMPSTILAWIFAVLFAYVTNRKWVFKSEANTSNIILKEMVLFFTCRFVTGIID